MEKFVEGVLDEAFIVCFPVTPKTVLGAERSTRQDTLAPLTNDKNTTVFASPKVSAVLARSPLPPSSSPNTAVRELFHISL